MDEKSDQIKDRIESQRDALGRNLDELEHRVKETTDWRKQFDRNPMLLMGAALGGGIMLGALTSGNSSRSPKQPWSSSKYSTATAPAGISTDAPSHAHSAFAHQRRRAGETIDQVKAALIAFGIAKAKDFLQQAIPGFDKHLSEAEIHRDAPTGGSSDYRASNPGPVNPYTTQSRGGAAHETMGSPVGAGGGLRS